MRAGKARAQINSKRGAGRGSRAAAGESSTAPNGVPCRQGLHRRNPPAASTIPRPARWARSRTLMPTLPRDRIRTPGGVRHRGGHIARRRPCERETAFARLEACATCGQGRREHRSTRNAEPVGGRAQPPVNLRLHRTACHAGRASTVEIRRRRARSPDRRVGRVRKRSCPPCREIAFARLEACATGETGQRGQRDSRACSRRAFARLEAHATGGRRRNARGCCCRALSRGILSAGDMSRSSSPPRFAPSSTPFSRPRSRRDAAHRHRPTHHPEPP